MVGRRNDDLYSSFPIPFAIDDGPQSSEDGSGVHSPTFLDKESHMEGYRADFRPIPPEIAFHSVGLVPPHFAANINSIPPYTDVQYNQSPHGHESIDHYHEQQTHCVQYHPERPSYPEVDEYDQIPTRIHYPLNRFRTIDYGSIEMTRALTIPNLLPTGRSEQKSEPSEDSKETRLDITNNSGNSKLENGNATRINIRHTQPRREASTVVIACQQCRSRKIRCDSTRPTCNNCLRRSNECHYDLVPKRRGPDKNPGTRQRSCKKRPVDGSLPPKKRSRYNNGQTNVEDKSALLRESMGLRLDTNLGRNESGRPYTAYSLSPLDDSNNAPFRYPLTADAVLPPVSFHAPAPRMLSAPGLSDSRASRAHDGPFSLYERKSSETTSDSDTGSRPFTSPLIPQPGDDISSSPSIVFERKTWWDDLLVLYPGSREHSIKEIASEFAFLFGTSSYWLFFINQTLFFRTLYDDNERQTIQPSLIFAGLALATLLKSSELGLGERGRQRALYFRDVAQMSLESAFNASVIDPTLAEAAMLLALFESSAHPAHTVDRACAALVFMDNIIHTLALTFSDRGNPTVTTFSPHAVPRSPDSTQPSDVTQCSCVPSMYLPSLGREPESAWLCKTHWDPHWTVPEIRREEIRRLCWSALTLVAGHSAHCAAFNREPLDLFLIHPDNFVLLFPDERLHQITGGPRHPPKQSIWALYCRSMLLWNGCLRLRKLAPDDGQRAEFALTAYMEMDEIKEAIDKHVCAVDSHLLYMAKEYLFNTQMAITQEFRRFVPSPDILSDPDSVGSPGVSRRQSEEWLLYQHRVAKRFVDDLGLGRQKDLRKHVLTRRPFYVWWFMSQIAIAMSLWTYDQHLIQALELGKTLLVALEFLGALWPCPAQRDRCRELKDELAASCIQANIAPPSPTDFSINFTAM